jgi:multicomponent Na+:H+ antiporter subunit G
MILTDLLQGMLLLAGVGFFLVGTLGILRFPDVYTRVHALTKADNLGLGLIVFGLLLGAGSVPAGLKLLLIWGLALIASAAAGYLVARAARRRGVKPVAQAPDGKPDALAGSAADGLDILVGDRWPGAGRRDMFRAVVMFIVFGLLMALAWVRLQAPDIALAEAAIGAGLTGVLLLDTLGYLRRPFGSRVDNPEERQ